MTLNSLRIRSKYDINMPGYLDVDKERYRCPACNKKSLIRFKHTVTNAALEDHVGVCESCGYKYPPNEYYRGGINEIPNSIFEASIERGMFAGFSKYLEKEFGREVAKKAVEQYRIGSLDSNPAATVFWEMDIDGKVRGGIVHEHDPLSGQSRRIGWIHDVLKLPKYDYKPSLFGGHLMSETDLPIGLTERSEPAVIGSIIYRDFVWMACGDFRYGIQNTSVASYGNRSLYYFPRTKQSLEWCQSHKVRVSRRLIDDLKTDLEEFKADADLPTLSISSDNVVSSTCQKIWDYSIVSVKTIDGNTYEIVHTREKKPGFLDEDKTKVLRQDLKMKFKEGLFDSVPCMLRRIA